MDTPETPATEVQPPIADVVQMRGAYSCPKHGTFPHDENLRLSINGVTIGNYCFRCYNDLLAAHCTRLPDEATTPAAEGARPEELIMPSVVLRGPAPATD